MLSAAVVSTTVVSTDIVSMLKAVVSTTTPSAVGAVQSEQLNRQREARLTTTKYFIVFGLLVFVNNRI